MIFIWFIWFIFLFW